jgi:integrase
LTATPNKRAAFTEAGDVAKLMKILAEHPADQNSHIAVTLALRFIALTAVRPSEAARAEWSEISFEESLWRIPGPRMKMKKPHVVPLSEQAVRILKEMWEMTGGHRFIFSRDGGDKPIDTHSLNKRLRQCGINTGSGQTSHGFRATFSTVLNAETDKDENKAWPSNLIELASARIEGGTQAIYNRQGPMALIGARRKLFQHWANRIDAFVASGEPVRLRKQEIA